MVTHYSSLISPFYLILTLLYTFILIYHVVLDQKKKPFFIIVISLFLLASLFNCIGVYFFFGQAIYIYISLTLNLIAYFMLFIEMLKENRGSWELNKNIFLVPVVVGVTIFLSSEILGLISSYKLSDVHVWYIYLFTILKLVFLSLGIIFYLLSKNNYRHFALLNWAITFFLFKDIVEIVNFLPIMKSPLKVFYLLEDIALFSALVSFYLYCNSPKKLNVLEKEF